MCGRHGLELFEVSGRVVIPHARLLASCCSLLLVAAVCCRRLTE